MPRYFNHTPLGSNDRVVLFDMRDMLQDRNATTITKIPLSIYHFGRERLNNRTQINFRYAFCRTIGYPFFCGMISTSGSPYGGLKGLGISCLSPEDFMNRVNDFCRRRTDDVPRTYIFEMADEIEPGVLSTIKSIVKKEVGEDDPYFLLPSSIPPTAANLKHYQLMISPENLQKLKTRFAQLSFKEVIEEISLEDLPPADHIVVTPHATSSEAVAANSAQHSHADPDEHNPKRARSTLVVG